MIKNNIFFFVVLGFLALQMIGVFLIESKIFAVSPLFSSPDNGRASIYYVFFIIFYFFWYVFLRYLLRFKFLKSEYSKHLNLIMIRRSIAPNVIVLFFCALFVFVFWGGWEILSGEIARGELRRMELGGGPLRPLISSWIPKFCIVFIFIAVILIKQDGLKYRQKHLIFFGLFLVFLLSIMTGFKGSFVSYMLPVVFLWFYLSNVSFFKFFLFLVLTFLILVLSTYFIFSNIKEFDVIIPLIFERIFVVPAEYPVYIINTYDVSGNFSEYYRTLSYFMGGTLFNFLVGASFDNLINYNFVWMMTNKAGYGANAMAVGGHTNTMSVVGEAYFALGVLGLFLFPFILASSVAFLQYILFRSWKNKKLFFLAASVHLFWSGIFPWVNGGDITRVINLNNLIFYAIIFVLYRSNLGFVSVYKKKLVF